MKKTKRQKTIFKTVFKNFENWHCDDCGNEDTN